MRNLMRYMICGVVCWGMLFEGCSKDDDVMGGESGVAIGFARPIVAPSTTKVVTGPFIDTYNQGENFKFFAQWDKVGFSQWEGTGTTSNQSRPYLTDVEARYNPSSLGWMPYANGQFVDYDWPLEGVLTFAAYSPAELVDYCESAPTYGVYTDGSKNFSGLRIYNYTVPATHDQQIDIMYSKRAYNKRALRSTTSLYNHVDLVFQHALSRVRFTARCDRSNTRVWLKKLSIKKVCNKGSFTEWVVEKDPQHKHDEYFTSLNHRKWSVDHNSLADKHFTFLDQPAGQEIFEETPDKKRFESVDMLLMPQRFSPSQGPQGNQLDAKDAYIEIQYSRDISNPDSTYVSTMKLGDLTPAWLGGKVYTYHISIGTSLIEFEPDVSQNWGDTADDVIINPE